ncbi:MAG: nucleotidyltransferase family protein [Actinobacteria bacterium]|nr:nucleotidyltransferase family protein [Actinomycetota bacterium]
MDAVVMAAGEGRRLRPLTERWPKPVLPIDGRPVIATLLHELAATGLERAWVVVGHLAEQIESLVGDGGTFGLEVRYAHQPEPLGSADAVVRALAAGATPPLLVVAADTVFTPGTVAGVLGRWRATGTIGGLAVRPVPLAELPERSAVRAEGGRLLAVVEKPAPGSPRSPLAGAPLWFLAEELCAGLTDLPGPPYELATAAQRAIDRGADLAALPIAPTRDLTRPEDVVEENFPYLLRGR